MPSKSLRERDYLFLFGCDSLSLWRWPLLTVGVQEALLANSPSLLPNEFDAFPCKGVSTVQWWTVTRKYVLYVHYFLKHRRIMCLGFKNVSCKKRVSCENEKSSVFHLLNSLMFILLDYFLYWYGYRHRCGTCCTYGSPSFFVLDTL